MLPMYLGLTGRPFVPHNLTSTQESPVPLLLFKMAFSIQILMSSGSKKGTQIYFFFSVISPGKQTPSRFPNRAPMERYLFIGHLYISFETRTKIPLNKNIFFPLKDPKKRVPLYVPQKQAPYRSRHPFPEPYHIIWGLQQGSPPSRSPSWSPSERDAPLLEPSFILFQSPQYMNLLPDSRFYSAVNGPVW